MVDGRSTDMTANYAVTAVPFSIPIRMSKSVTFDLTN